MSSKVQFNDEDKQNYQKTFSGFYKKSIEERQNTLRSVNPDLKFLGELPIEVANSMVENCIGKYELPVGLGLNILINGKHHVVPMAIEEPSVIAAISSASKMIADSGGFRAYSTENISISQIQFLDVVNPTNAVAVILKHKNFLVDKANEFCESMRTRGGGVVDVYPRLVWYDSSKYKVLDCEEFCKNFEKINYENNYSCKDLTADSADASVPFGEESKTLDSCFLIVHITVNACESMGANLVTKVAEGLAPIILELIGSGRYLLRIVSNFCDQRRAKATFCVPLNVLSYKGLDGALVGQRIIEAYIMAVEDLYRAATHNKGVMNGVDAVAIALGQDWRAIEAAAHAWAARSGKYSPLTSYHILNDSKTGKKYLHGSCEFPVPIGVRGGILQSHPALVHTHKILGSPSSRQLGEILVAVGLAQNFAAIRALVSEGILRGHMSLHCKNIAISAGVPPHLLSKVTAGMTSTNKISTQAAIEFLQNYKIQEFN